MVAIIVAACALAGLAPAAMAGGRATTLTDTSGSMVTDPMMEEFSDAAKAAESEAVGAKNDNDGIRAAISGALVDRIRVKIAGGASVTDITVSLNKILRTRCTFKPTRREICPLSGNVRAAVAAVSAELATLFANAPSAINSRQTLLALPSPPPPPPPGVGYR